MTMSVVFGVLLLVLAGLSPFPATGDFCDNLIQVAATLPKNTSSSPVLFATTTFGQAPDVVYALALCRGDVVNSSACGECVLVYSEQDFSNTTAEDSDGTPATFERWNTNSWGSSGNWSISNITGDADDVSLTVARLHDLLVRTVKAAAAAATPRRFATGVMNSPKVFYTLAQCTPDLSAGNSFVCLNNLLGMVNSSTALRNGMRIYVIRCYFRYEAYPFYESQPIVRLGTPSALTPTPTPATTAVKHERRMSNFWLIPIVAAPIASVAFLCFILCSPRLRKYIKGYN